MSRKQTSNGNDVRRFQPRAEALPGGVRSGPADRQGRAGKRQRRFRRRRTSRTHGTGRPASARPGSRAQSRRQAFRAGEVQARTAPVRRLRPVEGAGGEQRVPEAAGQFPLALLRPVLRGAEPELLYVPVADAERHPHALAIRRRRRPRRALWRRLCPCHHPRQPAGARDRGPQRRRHGRGDPGPRAVLARLGRRQYPQCHRLAHRRHRSAGADRHPPVRARMAFPHSQRARALRPAAQVQCRLRRRRHHSGAGGHQRHRLPGGRGEGRVRRRARRLVPPDDRRHHRPQGLRARNRHRGQAGRRHQGGRCDRARVHRSRRPHRPQQGAAEIRHRSPGAGEGLVAGRGKARPQARPRPPATRSRRGRPSTAPRISASIRRSSPTATGSASCSRSAR